MTQSLFTDAIAESYDDFRDLVRNVSATYYEVYSGSPTCEWENLFERTNPGEQFLRFNMQTHSEKGRSFFLQLHELERIAYDLPLGIIERPIPYFGSFVPPFGSICIAWTLDDIQKLITMTKKEQQMGMQVTAEIARRKAAKGG